jgi:hypothetical protein
MAARLIPGLRESVDLSKIRFGEIGASRRRRAAIAFLTGSALFVTSAAAMISNGATAGSARGFFSATFAPPGVINANYQPYNPAEQYVPFDPSRQFGARPAQLSLGPPGEAGKHNKRAANNRKAAPHSVATNYSSRRPVCVRLCDGFFFPASTPAGASDAASVEAACAGLCPDAPTALFYEPYGSDHIEDAFSAGGQRYTALPIALRYRSTQDNTCACHRSSASALSPLRDATLRNGDALMTPNGFLVFRGVAKAKHKRSDFAALAASPLPKDQRTTLQALERLSRAPLPGVPRSWVAAAPAAPATTASDTAAPSATAVATGEIVDKIRVAERRD